MSKRKDILTALLGVVVALVLWITVLSREMLIGTPRSYHLFHSLPSFFKEIQRGRIGNSFGNIIMFIPIGLLVPEVTDYKKLWKIAGIGLGFSLLIEIIQLITSRGCFDCDDLILNVLGCVIGYWLYRLVSIVLSKTDLNATGK